MQAVSSPADMRALHLHSHNYRAAAAAEHAASRESRHGTGSEEMETPGAVPASGLGRARGERGREEGDPPLRGASGHAALPEVAAAP